MPLGIEKMQKIQDALLAVLAKAGEITIDGTKLVLVADEKTDESVYFDIFLGDEQSPAWASVTVSVTDEDGTCL